MACDITLGRAKVCKDGQGGLRNAYFANDGEITGYTMDVTNTDMIATVTGSPDLYKWVLNKGTNSATTTFVTSDENGTSYFESVITLTFPKLDVVSQKQIKLLVAGNPTVVLSDNNSNFLLYGKTRGCSVTGGTLVSGAAMGDLSGYTLELTCQEPVPPNFIDASTEAELTTAGFTIVS
jgi:hypothetical protein